MPESGIQPERLLGPDGELLVPVRVPRPSPFRQLRLPLLIVGAVVLTLVVVGGVFFVTMTASSTPYATPVDPYIPKEIAARAVLAPSFGAVVGGVVTIPCEERKIQGHIDGAPVGVTVRIWDDTLILNRRVPVNSAGDYALTFSFQPDVAIKVWVYDSASKVLSGISNLRFGDVPARAYCTLKIDFHKIPS